MEFGYVRIGIIWVIIYVAVIYVPLPRWILGGFNFAFFLEALVIAIISYFISTLGSD